MSLRSVRRAKDITQETLAEIAGVDQTTISDLERGKNRNPSWDTVAKLSRALGVPAEELFPIDPVDSVDLTDEDPVRMHEPESAASPVPVQAASAGEGPREGGAQ